MVLGKNSRGEGRKLSNYCSTVSVAVFVAFCLVGVWLAMSSMAPIQSSVIQVTETINDVKDVATESGSGGFEVRSGDIPEESTQAESQTRESQSDSQLENQNDQKGIERVSDNAAEENQQEVVRDNLGEKNDLEKDSGNDEMRHVKPTPDEKEKDSDESLRARL